MLDTKTHKALISTEGQRNNPVIEQKIDIVSENIVDKKTTWRSGCITTDKNAVIYFGQLFFSTILVCLCSVMLIRADGDCSASSSYINILSFLAGKLLSTVVH
tara:strand:+ start:498 stop:806 length:309 start_codon:yes stop_codon:yes gene_type:complete